MSDRVINKFTNDEIENADAEALIEELVELAFESDRLKANPNPERQAVVDARFFYVFDLLEARNVYRDSNVK